MTGSPGQRTRPTGTIRARRAEGGPLDIDYSRERLFGRGRTQRPAPQNGAAAIEFDFAGEDLFGPLQMTMLAVRFPRLRETLARLRCGRAARDR